MLSGHKKKNYWGTKKDCEPRKFQSLGLSSHFMLHMHLQYAWSVLVTVRDTKKLVAFNMYLRVSNEKSDSTKKSAHKMFELRELYD